MYITIDPYYDTRFYHQCCSALKNNGVPYKLFVSTRPPYNWYFKISDDNAPKFINYESLNKAEQKYLVSCTKPSLPTDMIKLYRRKVGNWNDQYFMCNAYNDCLNTDCVVFKLGSRDELMEISDSFKVYFLGKYRQFRIFLCNNKLVQNLVPQENILFKSENTTVNDLKNMEMEVNYKYLFPYDLKLEKYLTMPYYEKRELHMVTNGLVDRSKFKF